MTDISVLKQPPKSITATALTNFNQALAQTAEEPSYTDVNMVLMPGPSGGVQTMLACTIIVPAPILGEQVEMTIMAPSKALLEPLGAQELVRQMVERLRHERSALLAQSNSGGIDLKKV